MKDIFFLINQFFKLSGIRWFEYNVNNFSFKEAGPPYEALAALAERSGHSSNFRLEISSYTTYENSVNPADQIKQVSTSFYSFSGFGKFLPSNVMLLLSS